MLRPAGAQRRRQNHHDRNPRRLARSHLRRSRSAWATTGAGTTTKFANASAFRCKKLGSPKNSRCEKRSRCFAVSTAAGSSRRKRWPACRSKRKPTPGSGISPAAKSNASPRPAPWSAIRNLLFLDEPTTGLDPQSRRQLWDIIRQFRDSGRTVLLTTHYMDEAERLCDRIAIVDHGKVIALGTPRELIASLGGEHVIEFTLESAAGDNGSDSRRTLCRLAGGQCGPHRKWPHQPFGRRTAHRPAGAVWPGWNRSIAGSPA